MTGKEIVKFITREQLETACNRAYAMNFNAQLEFENIPDVEVGYPINIAIPHNDENMRVEIILDETGKTGLLDMDFRTYESLPEIILEDDEAVAVKVGKIVTAYEEIGEE